MAAEVGAIHFDNAGKLALSVAGADRLADFVGHHEGRLILHVEIAAELQGANAFDGVNEDRDSDEVIADRKLAAGEDGPAGDAEL